MQENSKNLEVMNIEQILRDIAAKSSLTYADVAAGDAGGLKLRMKYTAHGSGVIADSGLPLLADELPDRRYLIASITKPIVAMSAVQLAAEGHFALNDAVRDHLPGFQRGPLRPITIRHLLTHTSGLPDMLPLFLPRSLNRSLTQRVPTICCARCCNPPQCTIHGLACHPKPSMNSSRPCFPVTCRFGRRQVPLGAGTVVTGEL